MTICFYHELAGLFASIDGAAVTYLIIGGIATYLYWLIAASIVRKYRVLLFVLGYEIQVMRAVFVLFAGC